eukprot:938718-Amphidinium_carterae.1
MLVLALTCCFDLVRGVGMMKVGRCTRSDDSRRRNETTQVTQAFSSAAYPKGLNGRRGTIEQSSGGCVGANFFG